MIESWVTNTVNTAYNLMISYATGDFLIS